MTTYYLENQLLRLKAFMNMPRIFARGDTQDSCGKSMNEDEIIMHGHAGDIIRPAAGVMGINLRAYKLLPHWELSFVNQ
jgi:hypothetical protein